ncbi:hypothetical protein BDZ94DRAFT_1157270 [Collybia nuda]|uniref:Uncharacterized protein n=1 Tax=Collybia nuda TaxID=64659 RepID=A0A9P5YDB0_9AGAR|nr:hypothetical protein BDZ94DRAFT_1157270 [Collybia nuda]
MSSVNASTGFTPFTLKSGFSPRIIPSLIPKLSTFVIPQILITPPDNAPDPSPHPPPVIDADVHAFMSGLERDFLDARDSLLTAKLSQAHYANLSRAPDHVFAVGDKVLLATANCRRDYMQAKDG